MLSIVHVVDGGAVLKLEPRAAPQLLGNTDSPLESTLRQLAYGFPTNFHIEVAHFRQRARRWVIACELKKRYL